jgi:hypothetical protein
MEFANGPDPLAPVATAHGSRLAAQDGEVGGSVGTSNAERSVSDPELPMLYCPVCSQRLAGRKCKLFCERCGYYMSCADYY